MCFSKYSGVFQGRFPNLFERCFSAVDVMFYSVGVIVIISFNLNPFLRIRILIKISVMDTHFSQNRPLNSFCSFNYHCENLPLQNCF